EGRATFKGEWQRVQVATAATPAHQALEGRTIAEAARAKGVDPFDFMLDLALDERLETGFVAEMLHYDEKAVSRLICDPDAHVSLSDAGAHLTFLCDAGFGLHLLGHWSRDRGAMTLPEAVRRLTAQPASLFGIVDRGRLAPGLAADLM